MDWPSINAEPDCFVLTASDLFYYDIASLSIVIRFDCYVGICSCKHIIADVYSQLKPCQVFCLLFLDGTFDDE